MNNKIWGDFQPCISVPVSNFSPKFFCSFEEAFGILSKLQLHLLAQSDFDTFNSSSAQA